MESKKEKWSREVEIDPRTVVTYESEHGPLKLNEQPMDFIIADLKRQAWMFCQQEGIEFKTLKFGTINQAPKVEDKPKGPWLFRFIADIANPRTLGQTRFEVAVEYPYITLVYRGVLEGDKEDQETVNAMKSAAAEREAAMQKQLEAAAEAEKPKDPKEVIEKMAKERGVTVTELLDLLRGEFKNAKGDMV
jgi:hypothetical protein